MNLGQHLVRKAASSVISARAVKQIRREHDEFVRTAQLGTVYYTLAPSTTSEEFTRRPVHTALTFVKVANWGPRTGQLITDGGTGSWTLWYQLGPLTATRMPTAADHTAADERSYAAFSRRAQAEIQTLFPASVKHLVAA